jgi:hypothetical protein
VLYDPDWLSLLDARERLKARGAEAVEAETAICLALRDRKFRRHWILEKVTYAPTGATLSPTNVRALEFEEGNKLRLAVPADLRPAGIDWDNSHPLLPWPYGPWQHQLLAHVAKLMISRVDFERRFPLKEEDAPLSPAEAAAGTREEASPPSAADREDIARPNGEAIGEGEGNPELIAPVAASESEAPAHEASRIATSEGAPSQTSQKKAAMALTARLKPQEVEELRREAKSELGRPGGKASTKTRREKAEQWKTWVTDNAPKIRATYPSFTQEELADELFEPAKKQKINIPGEGSVIAHISFLEHAGLLSKRERPLSKRARSRG